MQALHRHTLNKVHRVAWRMIIVSRALTVTDSAMGVQKDMNAPEKVKQIIHQTILMHILIFESECWTLTKG